MQDLRNDQLVTGDIRSLINNDLSKIHSAGPLFLRKGDHCPLGHSTARATKKRHVKKYLRTVEIALMPPWNPEHTYENQEKGFRMMLMTQHTTTGVDPLARNLLEVQRKLYQ